MKIKFYHDKVPPLQDEVPGYACEDFLQDLQLH